MQRYAYQQSHMRTQQPHHTSFTSLILRNQQYLQDSHVTRKQRYLNSTIKWHPKHYWILRQHNYYWLTLIHLDKIWNMWFSPCVFFDTIWYIRSNTKITRRTDRNNSVYYCFHLPQIQTSLNGQENKNVKHQELQSLKW